MKSESLTDTLRETLAVFDGQGEPRTTPEVADRLDLGRRSTYARLERLVERDRLETKKVGANARVWWRPPSAGHADEDHAGRRDRKQFESLVDAVEEYAIFVLDPDGYVQSWNPGAERIKGYAAAEIVGEHFSTFYTDDDRDADLPDRNLARATARGSIEDQGWRVRADGSRFWANVTITAIHDDGDLQGYVKVTRDMTERREYERSLRRERDLTEHLFETAPTRLAVFRADGSVERINSLAKQYLGIDGSVGPAFDYEDIDIYDEDGNPITGPDHPIARAIDGGEQISGRLVQQDGPDGDRRWVSLTVSPVIDDGAVERVVVAGKDVTDLKRAEQQLTRQRDELEDELEEIFGRIDDGFIALDEELRLVHVNERTQALLDRPAGELTGEYLWDVFEPAPKATDAFDEALETREPVSYERYYEPFDTWFENQIYPSETGLSVYFRDISERKARERELERYETIVQNVDDGIYAVDEDGHFTLVNDAYTSMTGRPREELLGSSVSAVVDESIREAASRLDAELVGGERDTASLEAELTTPDGDSWIGEATFTLMETDDGYERIGTVRDVTDRIERERQLEQYETIVETVDDGIYVLDGEGRFVVVNDGFLAMTEYDREDLVGAPAELVFGDNFADIANEKQAEFDSGVRDIAVFEEELYRPDGTAIVVESRFAPFDVDDETGRIGVVRDVTDRNERERTLERQREQLVALNSLNEVVRDITGAAIDQSTREEIEATVCDRLAASESYQFAWIGEADATTQLVEMRTEAGIEGYLDEVTISVDPDDERSEGPTGRAFRTGELQTTHDVEADSRHEPWREALDAYDFRSSAAIPIVHEETVYGVLNVYADRPRAFMGRESDLFTQLGEVVGHAIAAAERKQALMSDEVVELAFQIEDVFGALDLPFETDGTVTLDHAVPIGDDEYLVYGAATPDAVDTVTDIVEALPHWESVSFHGEDDPVAFQLRLSDPPVLSTVAAFGGTVKQAIIEDGDYRMTIHLATSVDVRQVVDAVEETYPQVELLRRRQYSRAGDDPRSARRRLGAELTDRQRTALEAAHHAGFFEWPRDLSGEEVATSLDIAPATFHQHLRKAERKVFDSMFSDPVIDPV